MPAIHALRPAALGIIVLAALAAATSSHPQAQEEFCILLQRVIADAPAKFQSLKTGTYHKVLQQWDAGIVLPGLATCRVDEELDNYLCITDDFTPVQASQEHARLVGKVQDCLAGVAGTRKSDARPDHVRTTVAWTLEGGHVLQVSMRNAKPAGRADKVFLYLLAN